jgi:hypothetical protein
MGLARLDVGLLNGRNQARHIPGSALKRSRLDERGAEQGEPQRRDNRDTPGDMP